MKRFLPIGLVFAALAVGCEMTNSGPNLMSGPSASSQPSDIVGQPVAATTPNTRAAPGLNAVPNIDTAREATKVRLVRLQNLIMDWDVTTQYLPPPELANAGPIQMGNGTTLIIKKGFRFQHNSFSFLEGLSRYEFRLVGDSLKRAIAGTEIDIQTLIYVFSPSRVEQLQLNAGENKHLGDITASQDLPEGAVVDIALGLRPYGSNRWMTSKDLDVADIKKVGPGRYAIEYSDDKIKCISTWIVDEKLGFAATEFNVRTRDGNVLLCSITCDNFERVDGVPLPKNMTYQQFSHSLKDGGAPRVIERKEIRDANYQLGSMNNTKDQYEMVWPAHTILLDTRVGLILKLLGTSDALILVFVTELIQMGESPSAGHLNRPMQVLETERVAQQETPPEPWSHIQQRDLELKIMGGHAISRLPRSPATRP